MFFKVGSTIIPLHDGIAPQVQHAQHTVAHMNQQLTSIGVQAERINDVALEGITRI